MVRPFADYLQVDRGDPMVEVSGASLMWVARSLRSHVAEAHVVVGLRRRIQAARIRFAASIRTKGTTPVVVVCFRSR